jgi:hypothetical protein
LVGPAAGNHQGIPRWISIDLSGILVACRRTQYDVVEVRRVRDSQIDKREIPTEHGGDSVAWRIRAKAHADHPCAVGRCIIDAYGNLDIRPVLKSNGQNLCMARHSGNSLCVVDRPGRDAGTTSAMPVFKTGVGRTGRGHRPEIDSRRDERNVRMGQVASRVQNADDHAAAGPDVPSDFGKAFIVRNSNSGLTQSFIYGGLT